MIFQNHSSRALLLHFLSPLDLKRPAARMAQALIFEEPSPLAQTVIKQKSFSIPQPLQAGHVLLEFIYAPINPQDHIIIADKYPIKPSHKLNGSPVPGYDGVARVADVGALDEPISLEVGDLVIPASQGLGTFRTHATVKASEVTKLSVDTSHALNGEGVVLALGLLRMSVCPAYFMLEDIRPVRPGDWIVANCGRGTIAQMIVQFAHMRGAKVALVVRGIKRQVGSNADALYTEDELATGQATLPESARFVLAVDAVSGPSAEYLVDILRPVGTLFNYGALNGGLGAPFEISSELLFAKGITMRGFKSSESISKRTSVEMQDLFQWLASLLVKGVLECPAVSVVQWEGNPATMIQAFDKSEGGLKRVLAMKPSPRNV